MEKERQSEMLRTKKKKEKKKKEKKKVDEGIEIELDVFPFVDLVCHWPKFYFLYIPTIKTIKRYFIMMVLED